MPPTPDLGPLLAFAHELADLARPIARQHFRRGSVERKSDRTPVTAADRGIERSWRETIARRYPDHGVLGEEEGSHRADAEWLWLLDPIDGTKAFASGNPLFGSLIGLVHRGVPVVGVLEASALGERWAAAKGRGAFHEGRPIRTRPARPLSDCVLYCTSPGALLGHPGAQRLRAQVQWTSWGGDCCSYGFVAMGGADLLVDSGLKPWDWGALVPIVEEAGGVLRDWHGQPLTLQSDGDTVCASSRAVADAALAVLRSER